MKMNKKTIIILIVVAVAAYLVWKKRKEGKAVSTTDTGTGALPGSLEYILANVPFTNKEIRKINATMARVNASTVAREEMQAKASRNGNTFDEQVVIDAIWLLYHPDQNANAAWIAGPDGKTDYGWRLQQKVLNLN